MSTIKLIDQFRASSALHAAALNKIASMDDATLDRALAQVDDATLGRALARVDDATLGRVLARVDMPVPVVADLDARMLAAAESGNLDMGKWHCGTTHCRAGWAVVFGGDDGARLEQVIGTEMAGRLIYEASTGRIAPNFYASNDAAIADIRACAALAAS